MVLWNIISKPPTRWTAPYRELFPKDLSLEMALNGLYLNVTALVMVDYVACIDPKTYPFVWVLRRLSWAAP